MISISQKKLQFEIKDLLKNCQNQCNEKNMCLKCKAQVIALNRYWQANIPVKYWKLEIDENFQGDKKLKDTYLDLTQQIEGQDNLYKTYKTGVSICFAGSHGIGKTMTCANILKRALEKGYTGYYGTLNDFVSHLVYAPEKATLRNYFLTVDFLVIDEFDPRYMGSDSASDLFGKILEDIFRARAQNNMPTFMSTNSPNVIESFQGSIKSSISSLMNYVKIVSVIGMDLRKEGK
jgi:DNA replication protein DnaC